MSIGKNIRVVRVARGIRSAELARLVDVTPNYVSLIENDRRRPSLSRLEAIARALDVPVAFLLRDSAGGKKSLPAARQSEHKLLQLLYEIADELEVAGLAAEGSQLPPVDRSHERYTPRRPKRRRGSAGARPQGAESDCR